MNSFEDKEGTIILPKFRIEYEKELKETLMLLGMEKAFDPYLADFTGIGEYRDDSVTTEEPRRIYIDSAFHKTFIEVNEEGTEAASTFHLWFGTMGAPEEDLFYMEVNRPFFFVIRENRTGVLLFMGYIADPPVVD